MSCTDEQVTDYDDDETQEAVESQGELGALQLFGVLGAPSSGPLGHPVFAAVHGVYNDRGKVWMR